MLYVVVVVGGVRSGGGAAFVAVVVFVFVFVFVWGVAPAAGGWQQQ